MVLIWRRDLSLDQQLNTGMFELKCFHIHLYPIAESQNTNIAEKVYAKCLKCIWNGNFIHFWYTKFILKMYQLKIQGIKIAWNIPLKCIESTCIWKVYMKSVLTYDLILFLTIDTACGVSKMYELWHLVNLNNIEIDFVHFWGKEGIKWTIIPVNSLKAIYSIICWTNYRQFE